MGLTRIGRVLRRFTAPEPPAAPPEYVALRFLPAEEPAVYFRFQASKFRMADCAAALAHAQDIAALPELTERTHRGSRGERTTVYGFANALMPVTVSGFREAHLLPHVYRTVFPRARREPGRQVMTVFIHASLSVREAAGATWRYTIGLSASSDPRYGAGGISADAASPTALEVPPLAAAVLSVEVRPDERTGRVSIGTSLHVGQAGVGSLEKDEVEAPLRLRVYDGAGALIDSAEGDLGTFRFG
jgi:hypothetical protein